MNRRSLVILILLLVTAVALPLSVYLVQQQQQLRSSAAPATTLCFGAVGTTCASSPIPATVGNQFTINVLMNTNENAVSAAELLVGIQDATLFETPVIEKGTALPNVLVPQAFSNGTLSITVGAQPGSPVPPNSTGMQIAVIRLRPTRIGQTQISFGATTRIAGIAEGSNVFVAANSPSAIINITGGGPTATPPLTPVPTGPTAIPTVAATLTPTTTVTPAPGQTGAAGNKAPVCMSLAAQPATGSAPLAVLFTANGHDPDVGGKVTKVTFNFADGKIEDMLETGGIGTATVSAQKSHSFASPGSYKVFAFLTDDKNGTSGANECTKDITVNAAQAGATPTPGTIIGKGGSTPSATLIPTKGGELIVGKEPPGELTATTVFLGIGAFLILLGGLFLFL